MNGDEQSRAKLFESAYREMHQIAAGLLRHDRQRHVLQATELVSECAIRMFGLENIDWRDRAHFAALAATTMRRVLVDEARRNSAAKRDGLEVTLVTANIGQGAQDFNVTDVDEALTELSRVSPDLAEVVELKYFGGLTNQEVSEVIGVSEASVKRRWRSARAWLYNELSEEDGA